MPPNVALCVIGLLILHADAGRRDRAVLDVYKQCSPIAEPVCQDVRYTHTRMPNLIGIYSQNEASRRIRDYYPLINFQCSQYLKLFLCSIYFPICDVDSSSTTAVVQPCQRLCLHVKSRCAPFMMDSYQLQWPNELDCKKLPATDKMCLSPDSFVLDNDEEKGQSHKDTMKSLFQQLELSRKKNPKSLSSMLSNILKKAGSLTRTTCLPSQINVSPIPNISCVQRCDAHIRFNDGDKTFANVWLIGWSLICLLSSFFTIVTFSCNTHRFMYPEKPIVFLSICYFFYSCGNLFGAILGRHNVICRPFTEQLDFVIGNGNELTWCKLNFLVLYFFSSASALWWVVLTVTWFLSASRHWGNEAIEAVSSILHLICWGIPALNSIFVLILHKIDPDELTGQCFVGNVDKEALLSFVLVPQVIYLIVGITFLGLGYYSILKVRKTFLQHRQSSMDTNNLKRLEKLMAKIGVFSILYIIPVTCTIVSYNVEALKTSYFDLTLKVLYEYSSDCVTIKGLSWSVPKCLDIIQPSLPSVEMKMLRIFMNLVVGITSGIWIWGNKKTFRYCCCFLLGQPKNVKELQLLEMTPANGLNPLSSLSYPQYGEGNMQFQRLNYISTCPTEPDFGGTAQVRCENPVTSNASVISESSKKP